MSLIDTFHIYTYPSVISVGLLCVYKCSSLQEIASSTGHNTHTSSLLFELLRITKTFFKKVDFAFQFITCLSTDHSRTWETLTMIAAHSATTTLQISFAEV